MTMYQHIPQYIDPVAFSIGFLSIRWYSLMYLVAFAVVYGLLSWRIRKGEGGGIARELETVQQVVDDWILAGAVALIVGARIGYVLLYDLPFFVQHPFLIVWPIDPVSGGYVGLAGMSYFGGVTGVLLASGWFLRRKKIDLLRFADFVVPAIPAGYVFGRLGNFLNGELYGRVTAVSWGMYFPNGGLTTLRHPSQLYEMFFEGIALFCCLWPLRNSNWLRNRSLFVYFIGYGIFRFGIEFFREPDFQLGLVLLGLSLGQLLAIGIALIGIGGLCWKGVNREETSG